VGDFVVTVASKNGADGTCPHLGHEEKSTTPSYSWLVLVS
jgi:hypothetical protein